MDMLQTIKSNNLVKTMCSDCGKKLSEPLLKPEASKYSCITDPVRECAKTQSKLPVFFFRADAYRSYTFTQTYKTLVTNCFQKSTQSCSFHCAITFSAGLTLLGRQLVH